MKNSRKPHIDKTRVDKTMLEEAIEFIHKNSEKITENRGGLFVLDKRDNVYIYKINEIKNIFRTKDGYLAILDRVKGYDEDDISFQKESFIKRVYIELDEVKRKDEINKENNKHDRKNLDMLYF